MPRVADLQHSTNAITRQRGMQREKNSAAMTQIPFEIRKKSLQTSSLLQMKSGLFFPPDEASRQSRLEHPTKEIFGPLLITNLQIMNYNLTHHQLNPSLRLSLTRSSTNLMLIRRKVLTALTLEFSNSLLKSFHYFSTVQHSSLLMR